MDPYSFPPSELFSRNIDVGEIIGLNNGTGQAAIPGSYANQAHHTPSLTTQLTVAAILGFILFVLFCLLRLRWPTVYAPRSRLRRVAPVKIPFRLLGWILPALNTSEMFMLQTVGLDAVMFLRFFKLSIAIFSVLAIPGLCILIPINIVGSRDNVEKSSDAFLSMNSMPETSSYLVAHLIFVYIFSAVVYYYLLRYTYHFLALRWHYLLRNGGSVDARSIMITNIPGYLQHSRSLREYFEELDIGTVEEVHVVGQSTDLPDLVDKRAECLKKLETMVSKLIGNPCKAPTYDRAQLTRVLMDPSQESTEEERQLTAQWLKSGYQKRVAKNPLYNPRPTLRLPTNRWFPLGPKVDAIDYYKEKFLEYDKVVKQLRKERKSAESNPKFTPPNSSVGFVTFANATSAHVAVQTLCHAKPFACVTRLAPKPGNVYWNNVKTKKRSLITRTILAFFAMIALILFWGIPVGFLSTFLSLENLSKQFPFLADVAEWSSIAQNLLTYTLPSVIMISYFNLLPAIMQQVAIFKGIRVREDIDIFVLSRVFFFQIFNVLLVFTLSSTVWNSIYEILNDPGQITRRLANSLPEIAPFFINYIIMLGIGYQPFKLLQILPMIWTAFRRYLCTTPRDFADVLAPIYVAWGARYPVPMLVFVITLTYSNISPLILVFGILYFVTGFIFYKYLFLYVYFKYYESSGRMWPYVVRRLVASMYIYHLLMCGYFSLKSSWVIAILTVPTVIINTIFFYYINKLLTDYGNYVPLYLLRLHQRRREELQRRQQQRSEKRAVDGRAHITELSLSLASQREEELFPKSPETTLPMTTVLPGDKLTVSSDKVVSDGENLPNPDIPTATSESATGHQSKASRRSRWRIGHFRRRATSDVDTLHSLNALSERYRAEPPTNFSTLALSDYGAYAPVSTKEPGSVRQERQHGVTPLPDTDISLCLDDLKSVPADGSEPVTNYFGGVPLVQTNSDTSVTSSAGRDDSLTSTEDSSTPLTRHHHQQVPSGLRETASAIVSFPEKPDGGSEVGTTDRQDSICETPPPTSRLAEFNQTLRQGFLRVYRTHSTPVLRWMGLPEKQADDTQTTWGTTSGQDTSAKEMLNGAASQEQSAKDLEKSGKSTQSPAASIQESKSTSAEEARSKELSSHPIPDFEAELRPTQVDHGIESDPTYNWLTLGKRLWEKIVDHFTHALPSYFMNMTDLERAKWLESLIEEEENGIYSSSSTVSDQGLGYLLPSGFPSATSLPESFGEHRNPLRSPLLSTVDPKGSKVNGGSPTDPGLSLEKDSLDYTRSRKVNGSRCKLTIDTRLPRQYLGPTSNAFSSADTKMPNSPSHVDTTPNSTRYSKDDLSSTNGYPRSTLQRCNSLPGSRRKSLRRRLTLSRPGKSRHRLTKPASDEALRVNYTSQISRRHTGDELISPVLTEPVSADSELRCGSISSLFQDGIRGAPGRRSFQSKHRSQLRYLSGSSTIPSSSIIFLHPDILNPVPEDDDEDDVDGAGEGYDQYTAPVNVYASDPHLPLTPTVGSGGDPNGNGGGQLSAPLSPTSSGPAGGSAATSPAISRRNSTNERRPVRPLGVDFFPSSHPYSRSYLLDTQNFGNDQYDLLPDKYTDYSQSPMELVYGVLDSGIKSYMHPSLVGELPYLWLPSGKVEFDKLVRARFSMGPVAFLKHRIRQRRISQRLKQRRRASQQEVRDMGKDYGNSVAIEMPEDGMLVPPSGMVNRKEKLARFPTNPVDTINTLGIRGLQQGFQNGQDSFSKEDDEDGNSEPRNPHSWSNSPLLQWSLLPSPGSPINENDAPMNTNEQSGSSLSSSLGPAQTTPYPLELPYPIDMEGRDEDEDVDDMDPFALRHHLHLHAHSTSGGDGGARSTPSLTMYPSVASQPGRNSLSSRLRQRTRVLLESTLAE
ncbi:hypothetical protein IWQ61_008207 [Dispira simplex]|nr:hypothetical protein IWQ61_008207 [Dispira simplex]